MLSANLVAAIQSNKPRRYWLLTVTIAVVAMLVLLSAPSAAQDSPAPLTLSQAVSMALEKNPLHTAALAGTRISLAQIREARSGHSSFHWLSWHRFR